jgi:hypothetical protein
MRKATNVWKCTVLSSVIVLIIEINKIMFLVFINIIIKNVVFELNCDLLFYKNNLI